LFIYGKSHIKGKKEMMPYKIEICFDSFGSDRISWVASHLTKRLWGKASQTLGQGFADSAEKAHTEATFLCWDHSLSMRPKMKEEGK
jgi:hypothetical protein